MSAYAHEMEREFSAQSLSTRGDSEMGSRYRVESGFYMTSFAATLFIGALVTVGVLLITLLISLTVMLQSCENRCNGVLEARKMTHMYDYCKIFTVHAELNNLEVAEFPSICRSTSIQHIEEGQYARDLNFMMWMMESYFNITEPGPDVVLIDIDDVLASDPRCSNQLLNQYDQYGNTRCIKDAKDLQSKLTLQLYKTLQSRGWTLILLSRRPERQQNVTTECLISAGFSGWKSLIMRSDSEVQMETREYFSRQRVATQSAGLHIASVISSQMDALTGPCLGKRIFKLPSPIYGSFGSHIERWRVPQQTGRMAQDPSSLQTSFFNSTNLPV